MPACATHVASNLGKAKSQGFDLSIKALLTPNWTAGLYVGYTNAQYTTDSTLFGETTARSGQAVSDISPWNVNVELGYQAPLAGNGPWYGHIENRYNSRNDKITPAEDPTVAGYDPDVSTNPSVNQLNAHLGLRFAGGADVSVFATNMLNDHPVLNRHDGLVDITSGAFTIRPRTYGVSLLYHW